MERGTEARKDGRSGRDGPDGPDRRPVDRLRRLARARARLAAGYYETPVIQTAIVRALLSSGDLEAC